VVSLASTTSLPRLRAKAAAAAKLVSLVVMLRTTSTSFMTGTGLKKCKPSTRSGRWVAAASSTMVSDEVLLAMRAAGAKSTSSSANSAFFTARSSVAASITRSHPARSATRVVPCRRACVASMSAGVSFPFSIARDKFLAIAPRPCFSRASSTSRTTVG